ncbi:MAG TPA: zinc-ribbon domain-containing protein [Gemmataceae bacterium]|nr:zinc-ribbon domain-containing protein [Gemmataceae bacterium]
MPIAMDCPNCQATFRLDDAMAGKKMKCKSCQHVFMVPTTEEAAAPLNMELGNAPAPAETAVSATPAPPTEEPDDAIADSPRKAPSKPPPLKKKSAPATPSIKKRQPASSGSGGMMALLMVLLGGGLLVCVGGACLVGFWSFRGQAPNQPAQPLPGPGPVANLDKKDGINEPPPPPPPPQPPPPQPPGPPLPEPVATKVVFGADGLYRAMGLLTKMDPLSKFGNRHKLYLVEFQAGKTYQIDLVNHDKALRLDPYLYLVDNANTVLAQDDDGGGNLNARITFRAPRTESLRIIVTHFGPIDVGAYTLTVRATDSVGKPFVADTLQLDGFIARELTLSSVVAAPLSPATHEAIWDAQGKATYWITNNSLQKISRDGKLEKSVAAPSGAHQLTLSADGLITFSPQLNEIQVLDPQTLTQRVKIPTPAVKVRWLVSSPTSPNAFAYHSDFSSIDLKTLTLAPVQVQGGPANRLNLKSLAMSPDGRFLCAQTSDFLCHCYRVNGPTLVHLATKKLAARASLYFQFSPDSKRVALTYPNLNPLGAKKVTETEVYAPDSWDKPAYTLPGYLKLAAFDTRGGLYATVDKGDLRYYADPMGGDPAFKVLPLPLPARRLLAPPRGDGCLVLAGQKSFMVEPAPKN